MEEKDIDAIRRLDAALRVIRAGIDPTVPTQVVQAFLLVALKEGQTLSELAEKLGTNLSTASRQLLDLGERNRKMEEGYRLVERQADPMNLRVNRYTLTQKGRLLVNTIVASLNGE